MNTALVFGEITFSILLLVTFSVDLSTSHKTNLAPFEITELAIDGKLIDGTIISSPCLNPKISAAKKIPSVQLVVETKCSLLEFKFSENNNYWHHKILTASQYDLAIKELDATE